MFKLLENVLNMCVISLEIDESKQEGQAFLEYVKEFARTHDFVKIKYLPNEETLQAFKEADGAETYKAKDIDDMFEQLENE